jgi:hypothetical protein
VGAPATTTGQGRTGAIVGGAVGGGAGAAIGQEVGGKQGAVVGAGIGGAAGAVIGRDVGGGGKQQAGPAPQAATTGVTPERTRARRDDCWNHPKMKSKAWAAKGC